MIELKSNKNRREVRDMNFNEFNSGNVNNDELINSKHGGGKFK